MRLVLVVSVAAIALLAALPAVSGDTCVPVCEVRTVGDRAIRFAYVPDTIVVQSGSTVAWSALDAAPHTATDLASGCFHVSFAPAGGNTGRALFFLADGALFGVVGTGAPEECSAATALPDGSFLLSYDCAVHPGAMQGRVVVK